MNQTDQKHPEAQIQKVERQQEQFHQWSEILEEREDLIQEFRDLENQEKDLWNQSINLRKEPRQRDRALKNLEKVRLEELGTKVLQVRVQKNKVLRKIKEKENDLKVGVDTFEGENYNTLKDAQGYVDTFTGKASEIIRQSALSGIALIWIFKTEVNGKTIIPLDLLIAGLWIITVLIFDLLQYLVGAKLWALLRDHKEKNKIYEFQAPDWINYPAWGFFIAKVIFIFYAYWYIIGFLRKSFL